MFSLRVAYPQLIEELKKFIDILGPKDLIIQRDSNMFAKAKQICNRPELNKMSVGIIYCRTRDECEEIASILSRSGIRAQPYHAGLTPKKRQECQEKWMDGSIKCIVATVSFGMGVDKPEVRFVVHWNLPQSLTGYYQESGRAGRDGKPSKCRIYYSVSDQNALSYLIRKAINEKGSEKDKTNQEHSMESFEKMVSYCRNGTKCRHSIMLAEFVGDEGIVSSGCKSSCDVCVEPKKLKTRLAEFEIAHHKNNYGHRSTTSNETDDDDSYFLPRIDDPVQKDKLTTKTTQMKNVVSEEFRLRNSSFVQASTSKQQANKYMYIDPNTRILFSQKLVQEIKSHFAKLSEVDQSIVINDGRIEEIADKEENRIYASKNNKMMYRAGIANYVKQLRDSTKSGQIYEPIKNYIN